MKIKQIWLFSGALIAALLFYYSFFQSSITAKKSDRIDQFESLALNNVTNPTVLKTKPDVTQVAISVSTTSSPVQNDRDKTNAIRQYMESLNRPIDFFGQIIDQDENPVSGVKIKVTVRHIKVIIPTAWGDEDQIITIEKDTDVGGRFEIHGVTGIKGFNVESIQKVGYALSPRTPHFFGTSDGSLEQPIIFKMWKLGDSAKLITHRTLFGFQPDGRIYTLDLLADKKIESDDANGDLRVQFQRQSLLIPKETYTWTLHIYAVSGGLIEAADEFEYLAPESSYQPQILFQMNSISPSSMPDATKDYYFTSRNAQVYGVMHLEIFSDYNGQSAILIESRMNPNGSRSLQP